MNNLKYDYIFVSTKFVVDFLWIELIKYKIKINFILISHSNLNKNSHVFLLIIFLFLNRYSIDIMFPKVLMGVFLLISFSASTIIEDT
jgi:hypothetical protein